MKMPQFNLAVCPRHFERALDNTGVAVLIGKLQSLFTTFGKGGYKRQAYRFVGRDRDAGAEAENWVEDGAGRTTERRSTLHGNGIGRRSPAT